jgi:rod shape-determining protein MreD
MLRSAIMNRRTTSGFSLFWSIALSSIVALTLTIIPTPQAIFYFWPDWMALIVVYWALMVPDRIGPWVGFAIGTLLEVLFVRNFGVLGFGLAMLAFTVNRAHLQLQVLPIGPQMVVVGLFIGLFKLTTGWLYGLTSDFTITTEYWYSLIGCMLAWPFVFILLQELSRPTRTA